MCVFKCKHTCDHAPLGGQKRVSHLPFSQGLEASLCENSITLRVTLMLHETNFSANKGTRCGVLMHEVQILFDAQRNSCHFQQCWGDWGDEL